MSSQEKTSKLSKSMKANSQEDWSAEILKTLSLENEYRSNPSELTDDKLICVSAFDASDELSTQVKPLNVKLLVEPKRNKAGKKAMINPKKFNKRFLHFTGNSLIFMNWDNVIAAGGCVSNVCNPNIKDIKKSITDVDLFIYGLNPQETREKILKIVKDIEEYYNGTSMVYVCYNKYTVNIIPRSKRQFKIQIILRCYKSKYEVLAGFDIDSCAVGFDGHNILWTPRSYNSFLTQTNTVDLSRRSPSYEHRLYKYVQRGFGIWIPFDHGKINHLYFMNNAVQGLERLLYLTQFHNHRDMERFLYKMTRKRQLKLRKKLRPTSDYEAVVDDLTTSFKHDFTTSVSKYNQKVPEEYRYMISHGSKELKDKLKNLHLLTENPGQQFTGSFHPITEGDWVKPIYEKKDHLGRNNVLLQIKSGECCRMSDQEFNNFLVKNVYDKKVWDSSLFNAVDYYILYGTDHEKLMRVWDNKSRIPQAKHNLYFFEDSIILAILNNRTALINHVLKNPGHNSNYSDKSWIEKKLIPAAIYCDNVDICRTLIINGLDKSDPLEIESYIKKHKGLINHCRANRIAKFYGINMTIKKKTSFSFIHYKTEKDIQNDDDLLAVLWTENCKKGMIDDLLEDPQFYEFISSETLHIIFKLYSEEVHSSLNERKAFINHVLNQIIRKYKIDSTRPQTQFSDWWQKELVIPQLENAFKDNTNKGSVTCIRFLQSLIESTSLNTVDNKDFESVEKDVLKAIEIFTDKNSLEPSTAIWCPVDPYSKVTAFQLFILRLFHNGLDEDFRSLKEKYLNQKIKLNIWLEENNLFREALFNLDSLVLLDVLVKKESKDKFLDKYQDQLGPVLLNLYESLKEKRINVRSDEIYKTYASPMQFNPLHIKCLDTGDLEYTKEFMQKENVTGQSPFDFLIYQLLEGYSSFYYKWFQKKDQLVELTGTEFAKLENMRESFFRLQNNERVCLLTTPEDASAPEILEILEKI